MRLWLIVETWLVVGAGIQLLVLAAYTDRFFAWTIEPAVTAAVLGVSYWGAAPLVWLAARRRSWAEARIAVYPVWVFATLTLITTLVHLDRFHLGDPQLPARVAAWAWLVVYLVVPVAVLVLWVVQTRIPGTDPPRRMVLPTWFRATALVLAAASGATGAALFVAPGALAWPWLLTALTSQAVGAWLIGIAVLLAQLAWENDWQRVRPALVAMTVLGALYLAVLLVSVSAVDWSQPLAAGLVVFAGGLLAAGAWGLSAARRAATVLTTAG